MKVQFCCGENRLDEWCNHDYEVDIRKPLPYENGKLEMVFCEHGLEHISHHEGFLFLQESYRILKDGGKIRICVPTLDKLEQDHARDIILGHGHQAIYDVNTLTRFLSLAGFRNAVETPRAEIDGHWKIIGKEKDDLETLRVEAIK